MKILTINVIGIPSGSSYNLVEANVFQDYDAVVVNPESLEDLYGNIGDLYHDRNERQLTDKAGYLLDSVNFKRRQEVIGLLERGGVVVCFMQLLRTYSYNLHSGGEDHWIHLTNYGWLLQEREISGELGGINYGRGTTIDYIDSGHPFLEYLNTKPSWSAYVDKEACGDWKVLASAFGTHAISLAKRVGLGHIILLPSSYDYNNSELLERCIIALLGGKDIRPQPTWAKSIFVSGQEELISKITGINDQIDALEKERKAHIDAKDKLERWKYLLYEKGKHQLEPAVREGLALLGCHVETQPDKDSDGLVTCDFGNALLEVVGSEGTIKIGKLGQLTRNMSSYFEMKGGKVKGILVGNPFCSEPLGNRPPKDTQKKPFGKELIDTAEDLSIAVLLSTDLYEVVCLILEGKLPKTEREALQERIFKGKGLVSLI